MIFTIVYENQRIAKPYIADALWTAWYSKRDRRWNKRQKALRQNLHFFLYVLKPSDINVIVILFANVSELDESVIILNETSLVCERNYYRKGKWKPGNRSQRQGLHLTKDPGLLQYHVFSPCKVSLLILFPQVNWSESWRIVAYPSPSLQATSIVICLLTKEWENLLLTRKQNTPRMKWNTK